MYTAVHEMPSARRNTSKTDNRGRVITRVAADAYAFPVLTARAVLMKEERIRSLP